MSARWIRLDGHGLPPAFYPLPDGWDQLPEQDRQAFLDALTADGLTATIEPDPIQQDTDRITDALGEMGGVALTDDERALIAQAVTEITGGAQ